jgi:hypothetical protein
MCLVGAMLASAAIILVMAEQSAFFASKLKKDTSALSDAEAGISIMLDIMTKDKSNYFLWSNRTLVTNFSEATLYITNSTTTNMSTGRRTTRIASTARFGDESRTTIIQTYYIPIMFYQVLANGNIEVASGAPTIYGDLHSNSNCPSSGGDIYGNVEASGSVNKLEPVAPFVATTNAPRVDMTKYDCRPSFPSWASMATNGGIYVNGPVTYNSYTLAPSNGVIYVNGDITLQRSCIVRGMIVASGKISITQSFDQYAPTAAVPSWWLAAYGLEYGSNWPCFLAGGMIDENNRNTTHGTYFAGDGIQLTQQRNCENSSLFSMTDVYIKNRVTLDNQGQIMTNAIDLDMGPWLK